MKLNIYLPRGPATPFLRYEMKTYVYTNPVHIFTAALIIIIPNWKQFQHPSAAEWICKIVVYIYIYIVLKLSSKKERSIEAHNKLGWISERSRWVNEASLKRLPTVWFHVYQDWGRMESLAWKNHWHGWRMEFFGGDGTALYPDYGDGYMNPYVC